MSPGRQAALAVLGLAAAATVLVLRGVGSAPPDPDRGGARAGEGGGARSAPGPGANQARRQSDGTRRMAERLAELAARSDPQLNLFLNVQRAEGLRALPVPSDPEAKLLHERDLAAELLYAGQTQEAVQRLEALWSEVLALPEEVQDEIEAGRVHDLLAIGYLRLGEQENCVEHHGTESCIMPIRGSGVHTVQRGSRAAIREFTAILERDPDDLAAGWLLNIAYMTVGGYPDEVPPQWLIPPEVFESEYDIKRFPDVAPRAGVDVRGLAGAAILDDFDGDGHLDLIVSSWGLRDPLRYFRNEGDGTFEERTEAAGLTGLLGGLNAVHADYDNDGDLDVFVLRGAWLHEAGCLPDSLLRNNGDGTFDDVTEEAGMLSFHPSQAGAWGDYDGDGWVDLFVANESNESEPPHPCELYHNNRDGTFTNVALEAGVAAVDFFKGAVWGDYDNDSRPDLYVTAIANPAANRLFHNDGPDSSGRFTFSDVADEAGVREPRRSFPTWFFDYDNDGWLDLFVSGYYASPADIAADYLDWPNDGEKPRLYHNRGDGTFDEVSREADVDEVLLTMGCNFGDLDNDGWLDFYAGTGNPDLRMLVPNRMFRNAGGKTFQDVTTSGGFGHLQKGHGVAFGDLDHDGDQDIFLKVGGALSGDTFQSVLFENPGHGNHWVTLKLVGTRSNRAAIGARIKITVEQAQGPREIHVSVTSGSSFGGSSLQQEIGLGRATRIRRIEVAWPGSGAVQVFDDVEMNRRFEIREGDARLRPVP